MRTVWDGPTPYGLIERSTGKVVWSPDSRAKAEGYRTAMNSPVVRALYEGLKAQRLLDLMGTPGAQEALSAYADNLREVP